MQAIWILGLGSEERNFTANRSQTSGRIGVFKPVTETKLSEKQITLRTESLHSYPRVMLQKKNGRGPHISERHLYKKYQFGQREQSVVLADNSYYHNAMLMTSFQGGNKVQRLELPKLHMPETDAETTAHLSHGKLHHLW